MVGLRKHVISYWFVLVGLLMPLRAPAADGYVVVVEMSPSSLKDKPMGKVRVSLQGEICTVDGNTTTVEYINAVGGDYFVDGRVTVPLSVRRLDELKKVELAVELEHTKDRPYHGRAKFMLSPGQLQSGRFYCTLPVKYKSHTRRRIQFKVISGMTGRPLANQMVATNNGRRLTDAKGCVAIVVEDDVGSIDLYRMIHMYGVDGEYMNYSQPAEKVFAAMDRDGEVVVHTDKPTYIVQLKPNNMQVANVRGILSVKFEDDTHQCQSRMAINNGLAVTYDKALLDFMPKWLTISQMWIENSRVAEMEGRRIDLDPGKRETAIDFVYPRRVSVAMEVRRCNADGLDQRIADGVVCVNQRDEQYFGIDPQGNSNFMPQMLSGRHVELVITSPETETTRLVYDDPSLIPPIMTVESMHDVALSFQGPTAVQVKNVIVVQKDHTGRYRRDYYAVANPVKGEFRIRLPYKRSMVMPLDREARALGLIEVCTEQWYRSKGKLVLSIPKYKTHGIELIVPEDPGVPMTMIAIDVNTGLPIGQWSPVAGTNVYELPMVSDRINVFVRQRYWGYQPVFKIRAGDPPGRDHAYYRRARVYLTRPEIHRSYHRRLFDNELNRLPEH